MLEQEREASQHEERPTTQKVTVDDLDAFLRVLPPAVRAGLESSPDLPELLEVILDLGRRPLARFPTRETHLGRGGGDGGRDRRRHGPDRPLRGR